MTTMATHWSTSALPGVHFNIRFVRMKYLFLFESRYFKIIVPLVKHRDLHCKHSLSIVSNNFEENCLKKTLKLFATPIKIAPEAHNLLNAVTLIEHNENKRLLIVSI